jgi:hypothetical protein
VTPSKRALDRALVLLGVAAVLQAAVVAPASAQGAQWVRQFGNDVGNAAYDMAIDRSGVFVVGQYYGPQNAFNGFLLKYDFSGNRLWGRLHFGKPGHDGAYRVAAGPSGIYVIASDFSETEPGPLLRRYHRNGNLVWSQRLGPDIDAVAVDETGIYVVGSVGFLPPGSRRTRQKTFVAKLSPTGRELWSDRFGIDSWAQGVSVGPGGVAVVGVTDVGLGDNSTIGGSDAYIRMYGQDGQPRWTRQFGTAQDDVATAVSLDSTGEYVAGDTSNSPQTGFVRKFDAVGGSLWHHRLASDLNVGVSAAALPATGNGVDVAGDGGDLSGAASPSTDGFVRGYDSEGDTVFTSYVGTSGTDLVTGIGVSTDGLFVAGATDGTFPGQTSHGTQDAFVARLG